MPTVLRRIRVVQPSGRLEHDVAPSTASDEAGELTRRRDARAAATHLRAQAALLEPVEARVQRVVEGQLDVDLAVEVDGLARLDRLDTRVVGYLAVRDHRERSLLVAELAEPRRRADEASE